jgi:hypothetical protein
MTLKKYLQQFTKEQLIEQINELHKKYKEVKDYYSFCMNPDDEKTVEKYKAIIYESFYPKRGFKLSLSQARKAISDFKKLSPSPAHVADVMVYFVECGVLFTNDFGDIDESFYNSMEGMFEDASVFIRKNNLENLFKERCKKLMEDSSDIGWGFHDFLSDAYYQFFENNN